MQITLNNIQQICDLLESTTIFGQQIWLHSRTTRSGKSFGYVIRNSSNSWVIETYTGEVYKQLLQSLNWLGKRTELGVRADFLTTELPAGFFPEIPGAVIYPNDPNYDQDDTGNVAEARMGDQDDFITDSEHSIVPVSDLSNTVVSVKLTAAEKKKLATASK